MEVLFSGNSDDLVHVTADGETEEYNVAGDAEEAGGCVFVVGGSIEVHAHYTGVWHFSATVPNEGDQLPPGVTITTERAVHCEYSMLLRIDGAPSSGVFRKHTR